MRLTTIVTTAGPRLHVRGASGYVDVAEATGQSSWASLDAYLADGDRARDAVRALTDHEGRQYDDASLGPVSPHPARILCIGVNYREHAAEGGRDVPTWPEVFVRGAPSVIGPYADLVRPALSQRFDYEGELGVVIGDGGRYIPAEKALDAVAGYVVLNDASARDWQRASTQWTGGKNFDGTLPIGPDLVTPDEVDVTSLQLTTTLNTQIMQSANTADLIVDVARCIEFLSSFTTLSPGDIIATGTPGGVGFARRPPVWLTPGDIIQVSIDGVGTIRNRVVAEEAAPSVWGWIPPAVATTSI